MQRWHNLNIISFDHSVADFQSGRDTPRKFLERCLEVIAARDETVKAFVTLNFAGARKSADGIKAKMMTGDYVIFKGPLKDNAGKVVIPGGTAYKQTDLNLEKMDYMVAGVVGHV